jgi:hypothetical protein
MNKISLSIDLLKLQGVQRLVSKSGKDVIVIDVEASRAKPHKSGAVYFELEAVENKDGANQWGNTHFLKEPTTKAERESGMKFPIIGNGKEYRDDARQQQTSKAPPAAPKYQGRDTPPAAQDNGDDDIPF